MPNALLIVTDKGDLVERPAITELVDR